jgi:cellulose synthase operon protein C
VACSFLVGCRAGGAAPSGKTAAAQGAVNVTAVPDEVFAASLHKLLREGKSTPERLGLLVGVVARQLAHAKDRFAAGQQERGLASINGAFYLVRAGEFRNEMLVGAEPALASAIAVIAPRGDEARAVAFLGMQNGLIAPGTPARRDNDEHMAALRTWMRDIRRDNGLASMGDEQRVQATRSLVEPTAESLRAAREATIQWIERALKMNDERRAGPIRPRREDALEAFRVFRSGAESLAALYLRHGDAAGALTDIERTAARKITPPSLYERLDRAANGGDATAWRDLLAWLWNPERKDSPGPRNAENDPELAVEASLLKAALFGTAIEAYRLDPTSTDVAAALATLLVQLGLPEGAPLVLADAVVAHPEPALLSNSLGLVFQTILREDEADDSAAARRVYAAAEPLLKLATRPEWKGRLEPGPGRVKLAMGTIETRAGNLTAAKPLLESSVQLDPTVDAHITLAAIERQAGRPQAALEQLTRALATAEAKQHPRAAGEAHLNTFEVLKDLRASDKANAALASALTSSLDARRRAKDAVAKVHAERLLARVLFRFSDTAGATRATERAFVYAGQDKRELAATVLESAQRAFLKKDIAAARTAVTRGLAGELADDDLVYAALWLLFTEKETKTRTDGTAGRALASIKDDGRWPGRLSAWALGKLKDGDLIASARTMGQKTEASFYTALTRKIAGDGAAAKTLAEVANSPAIDLVEVRLARDLLAGPSRFADTPPPAGTPIP